MPNCTKISCSIDNIEMKDIRTKKTTKNQDVEHIRQRFNFSEEEMQNVPQNPFTVVYFDQRTPNSGRNLHI